MPEHPLVSAYRRFSPTSAKEAERATAVFPGGDTRSSAHYAPYPLVIESGQGCQLTDIDGNTIVDFMNNFTSLLHGHAYPPVVEAVQRQVAKGTAYAAPNDDQLALGELLCNRVSSVERMRFTSSGTEATQMAIRCARAATGRQKVMKMEGGYHGSYELAEVSLVPRPNEAGPEAAPTSLAVDASFPQSVLDDTIICPYNEPLYAEQLIDEHHQDLAAVIVEPMLGSMGMIPATTRFLETLRTLTTKYNIVLIFDEVITLRLAEGGAQATLGITPDLTCMGKIIGGGLPVGAMGGREDLLDLFSPLKERPVMHASTFSGNALTMAAGHAAMSNATAEICERINLLGEALREGFNNVFRKHGVRAYAEGAGSLCNILFTDKPVTNAREALKSMIGAGHMPALLHLTMLRHGVMSASRLMYCVSSAMETSHVNFAVQALDSSLTEMLPHIADERPDLLVI